MSTLWVKLKNILPSTNLLVNSWFKSNECITSVTCPSIIYSLVKLYYQQKDEFIMSWGYDISDCKQIVMRNKVSNNIYPRIIGLNIIDYQFILKQNATEKFTWKLLIQNCLGKFHVGIIDQSKLNTNNRPKGDTYIGVYGLNEHGEAKYLVNPPSPEMKPINPFDYNDPKICVTGDTIGIELYISHSRGYLKFYINDNHIVTYPWIDPFGKYVLFVSMREAFGKFKILKYDNEIL